MRHSGSECAFHVCAGVSEGEIGFQPTMDWFILLQIEVIPINKEKFNFNSNNMSIIAMASEIGLAKHWSQ